MVLRLGANVFQHGRSHWQKGTSGKPISRPLIMVLIMFIIDITETTMAIFEGEIIGRGSLFYVPPGLPGTPRKLNRSISRKRKHAVFLRHSSKESCQVLVLLEVCGGLAADALTELFYSLHSTSRPCRISAT